MEWYYVLAMLIGGLVAFMLIGLPVVFAFFAINLIGAWFVMGGDNGVLQLVRNSVLSVQSFALLPIPLFIFMGEIMFYTGIAARAIDAVDRLIARVPGRLSLVAILGGTIFSSLSGSTIANTAMLSSTLLPEMYKRGYHPSISIGPIVATGGLAMLIPPSALAVLLGSIALIPISDLLIASIVPAIMLSAMFFAYVTIRCWLNPAIAPPYDIGQMTRSERLMPFVKYVLPLMSIFVVVVGSIIGGIATPTESAALGAAASLIAAAAYRKLTWDSFRDLGDPDAAVYGDDALHHLRLDDLLADPLLLGGNGKPVDDGDRVRPATDGDHHRHAVGAHVPRLLHGPGQHDDDHRADLHAHG